MGALSGHQAASPRVSDQALIWFYEVFLEFSRLCPGLSKGSFHLTFRCLERSECSRVFNFELVMFVRL